MRQLILLPHNSVHIREISFGKSAKCIQAIFSKVSILISREDTLFRECPFKRWISVVYLYLRITYKIVSGGTNILWSLTHPDPISIRF